MYNIWKEDLYNETDFTEASSLNANELMGIRLTLGKPLTSQLPKIKARVVSAETLTDFFLAGPLFIALSKLK